jgi:hypothetical protein
VSVALGLEMLRAPIAVETVQFRELLYKIPNPNPEVLKVYRLKG